MSIWEALSPYELTALILAGMALSAPIHVAGVIWASLKRVAHFLVWFAAKIKPKLLLYAPIFIGITLVIGVISLYYWNNPFSTDANNLANFGSYFGGILAGIGVILAGLAYLHQKDESRYSREKAEDLEEVLIASLSADEQLSKLKTFSELTTKVFNKSLELYELFIKEPEELKHKAYEIITLSECYTCLVNNHIYEIKFTTKEFNRPERQELRKTLIEITGQLKSIRSDIEVSIFNIEILKTTNKFYSDDAHENELSSAKGQLETLIKKIADLQAAYEIS